MTSTTVAYIPADQAAQYVDCARLGKPLRMSGMDYYLWSDVEKLRQPAPAPARSTSTRSTRSTAVRTATTSATRAAGRRGQAAHAEPTPAPARARASRNGAGRSAGNTTIGKPSEVAPAEPTSRLRGRVSKTARPAPAATSDRTRRGTTGAQAPKPYPLDPEQEAAKLAELPRAELLLAAEAFSIDPRRLHAKTIARRIVEAKKTKWDAGQARLTASPQDGSGARHKARHTNGRQARRAKVPTVTFSDGGR